jgi:glycerol-3-phosphate O-acyltransferase
VTALEPDLGAARVGPMVSDFGWLYRLLRLGRSLARVKLPDAAAERIRAAGSAGPVLYVIGRRSSIDQLALNTALNLRGLPLATWSNGRATWWWQRLAEGVASFRAWLTTPRNHRLDALRAGLRAGRSAVVCADAADSVDAFAAALDVAGSRPLHVVPVVVLWDKAPEPAHPTVQAFLLGSAPVPAILGGLGNAWFRSAGASIQVGVPIDLAAFRARVDRDVQPRALRSLVRRQLRREAETVKGPRLLDEETLRHLVLDNPAMKDIAAAEAARTGADPRTVSRRMAKDYRAIAARFRWWVIRLLEIVLRPLWTRVFSGVDVRPEDMDRIRDAMRNGTAILLPSHKSHLDYVLLSWVFYENDLALPHVVAGMNLAIWPVDIFLRGAGGFFVKRSFQDDPVFPAVFSRYLRELVRQGYPVEFFLEGGRTRSGKLLPPKVGVLGMVLEAAELRDHGREVTCLPVALAYEQVAEERAYAAELGGAPKTRESVGQLLKARSLLGRRYGRVYLRVGEPIALGPLVDPALDRPGWAARPRQENKAVLHELGERVLWRIGRATVLLPTSLVAAALLAHPRRGLRVRELTARVARFHQFLRREGLEEAASLTHFDQAVGQALDRFARDRRIDAQDAGGERIWAIVPEQRITLEFYKNQVLHAFAPAALSAAAIRALPDGPLSAEAPRQGFLSLCWLVRREFVFDPDRSLTAVLGDGLRALEAHGAIAREGDGWAVVDTERMGEIYGLVRPLLESYLLVARCDGLLSRALAPDALAKGLQDEAEGLLAAGAITRPEALSLVNLQNAIATLLEDGVLAPGLAVGDGRDALVRWLAPMVE